MFLFKGLWKSSACDSACHAAVSWLLGKMQHTTRKLLRDEGPYEASLRGFVRPLRALSRALQGLVGLGLDPLRS